MFSALRTFFELNPDPRTGELWPAVTGFFLTLGIPLLILVLLVLS